MRSEQTSYDYSHLDLDPVELQLMQTFHVPADAYARSEDFKSVVSQVSEASCSFNLSNAHITTEVINEVCTQTEPSGVCWRFTTSDFGDGIVESVASKQSEPLKHRRKIQMDQDDFYQVKNENEPDEKTIRKSKLISEMDEEQLKRSIGRSKKLARHRALMLRVNRIITFTYKENQQDRDLAYKHLAAAIRIYKRKTGKEFHYIAALEVQKRGAQHIHLATNEFHDINVLRDAWQSATKDEGNVNVTKSSTGNVWKLAKIISYIMKYISKDADNNKLAKKRFSSSRNIPEPIKHTYFLPITMGDSDKIIQDQFTFQVLKKLVVNLTGGRLMSYYDVPTDYSTIVFCKSY